MAPEPGAEVEVRFFSERPGVMSRFIQDFWVMRMLVSLNSTTFSDGSCFQHLPVGIAL